MGTDNFPTEWSGALILKALPFSFQLAMLGFIDTLLTSRIVDEKVEKMYPPEQQWRPTYKNLELVGQAVGNGFCALFGGIPGAQATIRSVLILNEGAVTRMAGILAGLLTIIEMAALQSLVAKIPQCVLTGVLFKVDTIALIGSHSSPTSRLSSWGKSILEEKCHMSLTAISFSLLPLVLPTALCPSMSWC